MYGFDDPNNNNNIGPPNWQNTNCLPPNYLGYIEVNSNGHQDYLNSSQTEKTWLNSSLNEKNFLNSSLNLPIEQRYNSLNEMVAKIIEDEAQKLANSSNNLNFFNQKQQQKIQYSRQESKKRDEPLKQQNSQIKNEKDLNNFYRQTQQIDPRLNKTSVEFVPKQQPNPMYSNHYYQNNLPGVTQPITNLKERTVTKTEEINKTQLNKNVPSINPNGPIFLGDSTKLQKLIYPTSVSHQLATLSPDQQNFLLQQQNELVLALAASETFVQNQQNRMYLNNAFQQQFKPSQTVVNNQRNFPFNESSQLQGLNNNYHKQPYIMNQNDQFIPNQFNINLINQHLQFSNNLAEQNQIYFNNGYQMQQTDLNHQNLFENIIDPGNSILQNRLNEKLKFLAIKPSYRQHRRTVPANELHVNIEECIYQFKSLELERKKVETDLSYITSCKQPVKQLVSIPMAQLPRLSPNPSRVDRLIIDSLKEHYKTCLLISRIDNIAKTLFFSNIQLTLNQWLNSIKIVQARRNDELVNNSNRQRLALGHSVRVPDDRDVILLANAVNDLARMTKKARTSLWCSWQIGFFHQQPVLLDDDINFNENTLNNSIKIENFSKKIFQINTDLNENHEGVSA